MLLVTLGSPVLMGTWWGLVPALVVVAAMAIRTMLEDRTLRAGLPGYADYAARVRFKLMLGLW